MYPKRFMTAFYCFILLNVFQETNKPWCNFFQNVILFCSSYICVRWALVRRKKKDRKITYINNSNELSDFQITPKLFSNLALILRCTFTSFINIVNGLEKKVIALSFCYYGNFMQTMKSIVSSYLIFRYNVHNKI